MRNVILSDDDTLNSTNEYQNMITYDTLYYPSGLPLLTQITQSKFGNIARGDTMGMYSKVDA